MMEQNKLRTAVIGLGNMGSAHAFCIGSGQVRGMELTAICDLDADKITAVRTQFPQAAATDSWRELIARQDVDAVIIAVPHLLHSEIAAAAMRAGKHVLTEKPADISITQARTAIDAARETGKVFGIMFNQRTNSLFARAREIVRSGGLGELKRSVWIITNWYRTQAYYDSGGWRGTWSGEGGGVLLNQAPHNLDLWQWICGMPVEISAFCSVGKYHRIEVEDEAAIYARYSNGATGTFLTSTGEYPGTNRLEISGTLGKIVLEDGCLKWWKLLQSEDRVRTESRIGSPRIEMEYSELHQEGPDPAHRGILQNFADAILLGTPLLAPGEEGIRELELSNAAYLSAWTGNRAVPLPLDGEAFDRELKTRQTESVSLQSASHKHDSYDPRWQVNW